MSRVDLDTVGGHGQGGLLLGSGLLWTLPASELDQEHPRWRFQKQDVHALGVKQQTHFYQGSSVLGGFSTLSGRPGGSPSLGAVCSFPLPNPCQRPFLGSGCARHIPAQLKTPQGARAAFFSRCSACEFQLCQETASPRLVSAVCTEAWELFLSSDLGQLLTEFFCFLSLRTAVPCCLGYVVQGVKSGLLYSVCGPDHKVGE